MLRCFLHFPVLAFALAGVFASADAAKPAFGKKPNVIVMMTDDQGYAPVGRHGHPRIHTPTFVALPWAVRAGTATAVVAVAVAQLRTGRNRQPSADRSCVRC